MHPEICKIGIFTIYSYGLMLAVSFLVSSFLLRLEVKKRGVNPDLIFNFAFTAFIFGIIGARLFYVVENIDYYIKEPLEIIMFQHGGLSWFGGLILGALSAVLYLKKKNLPVYKILDLVMPFIALGQAIGRIGCLLNGCCFGRESDFGIYFSAQNKILIPAQAHSSFILAAIFIFLRLLQDRPHKDGEIFFSYLLLYSLKRFFIEFWRADNPAILGEFTLFQIISIVIFFLSAAKLAIIKFKG